ncbi:metal ABC transporter solute-binding protein, Zn/Mn family [Leptolyngbya sp. O-77]|uniref:metal ABC transporter solute-binding protein, Zn/Mn family n=1 Tax=Leptolyngbya sp. O-77 TaxID=1080068 RepID=UPI00074D3250|nr:zinc ABC transporter substrate-binding protein [Leptolyngbya sp. O-77]BAU40341.1 High-affinity zinc uptake system binding-protein ZnuA precursor [Leptolyngbya sp. O-77]
MTPPKATWQQAGSAIRYVSPKRISIVVASAIALGLGSCTTASTSNNAESQPPTAAADTPELRVVTTFIPMTQFTKAVAGDRAEVTQLLPTNVGPHDYQARPEDAQRIAQADVLVKNGLEMESFLDSLIENAGSSNLKVIDSSAGIATITTESIEGEAHDHGHSHSHDHDHNHAHDHAHDHAEETAANKPTAHSHSHGEFNPHIWLDPKRAIRQVENIRDGLIAADPDGQAVYTANAAAYIQQLQALDEEIAQQLRPFANKTFVAFHDFAPYFAESYGLKADFLVDVPDVNPSPQDVKRVMDTVKASNLKTLLTEPQSGEDAFAAIAQDLDVNISTFDPMETGGPEALQPDYYIATMRQNVKALVSAFTGGSTQSTLPHALPQWMPQKTTAVLPQRVSLRF